MPERAIQQEKPRKNSLMKPLAVIIFTLAAWSVFQALSGPTIVGSGVLTSESRSLNDFTGVRSEGSFEVTLTQGPFQPIRLVADDNILKTVTTQVEGGVLVIDSEESFSTRNPIKIAVTLPNLKSVENTGSGSIMGTNAFESSSLKVALTGSADVALEGTFGKVGTNLTGSGTLTLKGRAEEHSTQLTGSGDLEAGDMICTGDTTVNLTGSGNCGVNTTGELQVNILGSGNVIYSGPPKNVRSRITGSGTLQPK